MRCNRKNRRGGIAVIVAVGLVVLITFIGLAIDLGLARLQRAELQASVDAVAAAAASGLGNSVEEARERGLAVADAIVFRGAPLGLGPDDIEVGFWDPEARAFTPDPDGDVVRVRAPKAVPALFARIAGYETFSIQAETAVMALGLGAPGGCGILGGRYLDLGGNVEIDSYDASEGPYGGTNVYANATTCSNGDVDVYGSVEVWGDARPGPDKEVTVRGNAYVDGSLDELDDFIEMPVVDLAWARVNNDNAASGLGPAPDVKLSGKSTLTLGPGVVYLESLQMSGKAQIDVVPPLDLYVAGDVKVAGQGVVNAGQHPADLTIYSGGSDVRMAGTSTFYGSLVAPDADVHVAGTADWFGLVAGGTTTFKGTMVFHMDESLPERFGLDLPIEADTKFLF